jgi:hypothetical protein
MQLELTNATDLTLTVQLDDQEGGYGGFVRLHFADPVAAARMLGNAVTELLAAVQLDATE